GWTDREGLTHFKGKEQGDGNHEDVAPAEDGHGKVAARDDDKDAKGEDKPKKRKRKKKSDESSAPSSAWARSPSSRSRRCFSSRSGGMCARGLPIENTRALGISRRFARSSWRCTASRASATGSRRCSPAPPSSRSRSPSPRRPLAAWRSARRSRSPST